jgi:Raf kinase inhibitor-like YbhB/YbcL family protein
MVLGFLSGTAAAALTVTSHAFVDGGRIPDAYTCAGADDAPPIAWDAGPPGTVSYALIVDDPDAPRRTFLHWATWNLVQTRAGAGVDMTGTRSARNDFGTLGYRGPCPPRGHGDHRYHFRVYALDTGLSVPEGAPRHALEAAMRGHVLAEGVLVGLYGRR